MSQKGHPSPQPISRIQRNLLAEGERRLLNWLCARMPGWLMPDGMTAIGLAGAVAVAIGYAASGMDRNWLWLAVAGYVINWFGDSMDGSLARWRKIERPNYGYFLDHSCDALATVLIVGGLGLSPHIEIEVALFAVLGYLLLSIHTFLSARVLGEFRLSYVGAGPTELRLMLIGLTLAMYWLGPKPDWFAPYTGFDLFAGTVSGVLVLIFAIQTSLVARRLRALGD